MRLLDKLVVLTVSVFTLLGCAQQPKESKDKNKMRPIIKLYSNAKKSNYPKQPVYVIDDPKQSGCFYEIYLNDFLVAKLYKNVTRIGNVIDLNDLILKSGTQKVTVKLFPATDVDGKQLTSLSNDTSFELQIKMYYNNIENEEDILVKDYFAPTTMGKKNAPFKYPNTPYYEETFTFEAEVPYEIQGWNESQDLSNIDKDVLEREVLDFYSEYDKVIQSQDEEKWVKLIRNAELEFFESVAYNNLEAFEIKERINEYSSVMDSELIKSFPLDTYKMVYAAGGKVVTLQSLEFPGESAYTFGRMIDYNGQRAETRSSRFLFLHKPKGSNQLEIIRL